MPSKKREELVPDSESRVPFVLQKPTRHRCPFVDPVSMIKSGEMAFTANEQPYYIATTAAYLLYMNVKYHFDPQGVFNTGLGKVDKNNIDVWAKLVKNGQG